MIPNKWRIALITPIFKKGLNDLMSNHEFVNLTCVVCKIIESVVRNNMNLYFLDNNLLNKFQHGIRSIHSTTVDCYLVILNMEGR